MTIYKAGLRTSVLSHVINAIEKNYKNNVFILNAQRTFYKEMPASKNILSYLQYRERSSKTLQIKKESETQVTRLEWMKIIETIRKEGFVDLTTNKLGFLIENTELKKIIEQSLNRKIGPTKFVLIFNSNPKAGKEGVLEKRELFETMREYVEKLGLMYATLELNGIYTLQDWRTNQKYNLLSTEKINLEKKVIINIIHSLFKPSIRIAGKDIEIRFIKWYELAKGNVLKLTGYERI